MKIYFKFLNDWILLNNDLDDINGDIPSHFVEFIDEYDNMNGFVEITHNNQKYHLHFSNIQWIN